MTFDLFLDFSSPLSVVPIVVNAGAALGPMLIAPITTFFGILFKPSALIALLRRKPWLPVPVIAIGVLLYFLCAWLFAPTPAGASARNNKPSGVANPSIRIPEGDKDWTSLALRYIRKEQNASKTSGIKPINEFNPEEGMWVLTAPAVSDDLVFMGASIQDAADFIGQLYAVDRKTWKQVWKLEKFRNEDLHAFFSSPVLSPDKKYLIIGQGLHADKDCSLICVEAATGAPKWSVKTPLHIESSPAVWKDMVVVGAGAIEDANHKPMGDPGYVFAVEISTGKELWKHAINDPECSPAIAPDGTIYIGAGFNGNAVVALRPDTDEELKAKNLSRELWRVPAPYPITGSVTLAGDLVLVGGGSSDFVNVAPVPAGIVMALDAKTGAIKWQAKTEDSVLGQIIVKNNVAYCPVLSGNIQAIDMTNGKTLWLKPVSGRSQVKAGLAISNDTLFAVTADGFLALLKTADGSLIEKHPLNAPGKTSKEGLNVSAPTINGQDLYLGTQTSGLRHFQLIQPK